MATQPTCDERIRDEYAREIQVLRELVRLEDERPGDDLNEDEDDHNDAGEPLTGDAARQDFDDRILCIMPRTVHYIQLSTGGPEDGWEVTTDEDGDITRIEYVFKDWFDGARLNLVGDDLETAEAALAQYVEN